MRANYTSTKSYTSTFPPLSAKQNTTMNAYISSMQNALRTTTKRTRVNNASTISNTTTLLPPLSTKQNTTMNIHASPVDLIYNKKNNQNSKINDWYKNSAATSKIIMMNATTTTATTSNPPTTKKIKHRIGFPNNSKDDNDYRDF